ncbi:uncharacterized protein [Physcomitrium patens]|uniref:uncharacterized protein n=1 Tax=Physcomitrium patens TaxID=3218 RepID=UPI000D17B124|nr:uncharacterized protein LOC112285083 [Physcomitrium patens]|eukprot:XP_024381385.1 uncharacterized protein LOC112285083 [Physcomitrella patens]
MMRHGDREKEEEGGEFGKGRRAPGHKVNSEEDSLLLRDRLRNHREASQPGLPRLTESRGRESTYRTLNLVSLVEGRRGSRAASGQSAVRPAVKEEEEESRKSAQKEKNPRNKHKQRERN